MEKLKKILHGSNTVKGATGILVVTLLISNILGMVRDHFIAQKIPANLLDTYYAAFRLPDLIFNLFILGAIAAAFIPVFTAYISKKKEEEAWKIANSFLNLAILVLIIFVIILALIMPYIIPLLVPNFTPEKQNLTVKLSRLMLFSPIFFGISYIFGGILNSFKRFLVYSVTPLIYNLSIIISTIYWADKLSVYGVVYGVLVGAFLHMIIQLPIVLQLGYRYKAIADWNNPGVRKIFRLMVPRSIGLGANQIMLLVFTSIASTLSAGSVAIYNLADNIQTMPVVVFGTSFATALFPTLSETASLKNREKFATYLWRGIRAIIYLLIPAGIGIILLRSQIVRLILGSGWFGWSETINTADTLGYLAISLFAQGLISLLARSFYALQDTKIPMITSIISFIISIVLGYVLAFPMRVAGLGLAFTFGSIINFLLLYIILRKRAYELKKEEPVFLNFLFKVIAACIIMVIAVQGTKYIAGSLVNMEKTWGVFVQTLTSIIIGSGFYLLSTYFLGCEEIKEIIILFKKRFNFIQKTNE